MDLRTQEADRELETFRASQSVEGRFLAYCRGRTRHFWVRQVLVVVGFPIFLTLADLRAATLVALVLFLGDLFDCVVLARFGKGSYLGRNLPFAIGVTTATGAIQAVTVAAFAGVLLSLGGGDTQALAGAICLGALLDGALLYGVHRGASLVRVLIYTVSLGMMVLQIWLSTEGQDQRILYDAMAALLLTYLVWVFARHVIRTRARSSATRLATLLSARDLAHVNAALEASRQTTRQLAMVAEKANDSVIITDPKGVITWVNRAFTKTTGYRSSEAVGRDVNFLNYPGADEQAIGDLNAARDSHRSARAEIVNRHRDGHPLWVEVSIAPVFDDAGEIQHMVSVERDISEAKQRENALAEARKAAEDAVRARHNFLATMSHEIRTPMNGVIGTADLLQETTLDDTQRSLVRTITSSGEALLAIVNDILDFSKLEAGRLEVASEPFDLEKCLLHSIDLVAPLAEAKGLSLRLVLPSSLPASVVGDEGRFRQVLLNLLGNAIKFTEQGSIRLEAGVRLEGANCHLFVSVRDTGVGIPQERLDHIFDSFTQADSNVAGRFGGTGLGLSISRLLMKAMGGEISVSSSPGEGAAFFVSVTLPVACEVRDNDVVEASTALPEPEARLTGLRVLVAEDNKTNTLLIDRMLASMGVEVTLSADGRQAVDQFRAQAPDLVLMDVHMPILNGLEATQEIRALEKRRGGMQVPIIALTANAFPEDRRLCLEAGMNDVVTKPFRKQDLRMALLEYSQLTHPDIADQSGAADTSLSDSDASPGHVVVRQ